jgi:catechol 2,3-dioxygenase-like lactoylglutathione lyase family enzyme
MIDHLGIVAADLGRSGRFYRAVLEPLGVAQLPDTGPARSPIHLALAAPDRAAVDRFHAAGLEAGVRGS